LAPAAADATAWGEVMLAAGLLLVVVVVVLEGVKEGDGVGSAAGAAAATGAFVAYRELPETTDGT